MVSQLMTTLSNLQQLSLSRLLLLQLLPLHLGLRLLCLCPLQAVDVQESFILSLLESAVVFFNNGAFIGLL